MKNGFKKGSGCFVCTMCGKNTRATGRGDNENVRMCAECYDKEGDMNQVQDGTMTKAEFNAKWNIVEVPAATPTMTSYTAVKAVYNRKTKTYEVAEVLNADMLLAHNGYLVFSDAKKTLKGIEEGVLLHGCKAEQIEAVKTYLRSK